MENMDILHNNYPVNYYETHHVKVDGKSLKAVDGKTPAVSWGAKKLTLSVLGKETKLQQIAKVFQNTYQEIKDSPYEGITALKEKQQEFTHLVANMEALVQYRDKAAGYGGLTERGLALSELIPQVKEKIAFLKSEIEKAEGEIHDAAEEIVGRLPREASEEVKSGINNLATNYFSGWMIIEKKVTLKPTDHSDPMAVFTFVLNRCGPEVLLKLCDPNNSEQYANIESLNMILSHFKAIPHLDINNSLGLWEGIEQNKWTPIFYTALELVENLEVPFSAVLQTLKQIPDQKEQNDFVYQLQEIYGAAHQVTLVEHNPVTVMEKLSGLTHEQKEKYSETTAKICRNCDVSRPEVFMSLTGLSLDQVATLEQEVEQYERNVSSDEFFYLLNQVKVNGNRSIENRDLHRNLTEALKVLSEGQGDPVEVGLPLLVGAPAERRIPLAEKAHEISDLLALEPKDVLPVIHDFSINQLDEAVKICLAGRHLNSTREERLEALQQMRAIIIPPENEDFESFIERTK